jgi:HlyD family secretion protein
VSTARLDVKRAEADLETTLGGTPGARADAILVAQQSVELAQGRLDRILAPPHPADVAAAEAEVQKAEADLEALVRSDRTQPVTKKEIDAAKAAITAARLKLERLLAPADPADVTAARLELERARVELRRLQAGPSHAALEAARQAVDAANARLRQFLSSPNASDVTSARLDIRRAEAELAVLRARHGPASATDIALARLKVDTAEARLSSALAAAGPLTVRAPRAGTVTALLTTLGAFVDRPTPIVAMADLDRLEVRVDLSEFDIAKVKRGQQATVSVDALGGESFRGEVLFAALTGTNTSGVVTFSVQVGLTDAPDLKPGMNVNVRIVVANRRNVVLLPLDAVTQEGGEATVTVLDRSGQPVSRTVRIGLANNKNVEIVKGLRAGESVVLEPGGGGGE